MHVRKRGGGSRIIRFYLLREEDLSFVSKHITNVNNEIVVRIRVRDAFVPADGWLFLAAGNYLPPPPPPPLPTKRAEEGCR